VVPQESEPSAQAAPPAECEATCAHHRPVRLSWAKLLKRVFKIDMAHCPNCGGELKIIAAIMEVLPDSNGPEDHLCLDHARASVPWQPVIEKILTHLGQQADCGRMTAPARGHAPQEGLVLASASAARGLGRRHARQPVGRNCKRPERLQPTRFRRPRAHGRGDRLR